MAIPADSNVEMTWRVFAGEMSEVFVLLLRHRCKKDGYPLDDATLAAQFRLHLHRGIAYLAGEREIRSVADLISYAIDKYNVGSK